MENERKSVFERLGNPVRSKQSPSNVVNSARSLSHELNRDDLRHRVVHLTKRRSHHQPQSGPMTHFHQHNLAIKRPKLNVPEPPPPPPLNKAKSVRRRKKKPKVVDEENLDEGEIVDDDDEEDEYEEYDEEEDEEEEEEGEIDFQVCWLSHNFNAQFLIDFLLYQSTRTRHYTLPQGDNISLSSLSDHNDEENAHHPKNGRSAQAKLQQSLVRVKSEMNDTEMIRIKEEIFDDEDNRVASTSQVGSDYSDWSDGADDELLVLENNDQKGNKGAMTTTNGRSVLIKEEMEDSITCKQF